MLEIVDKLVLKKTEKVIATLLDLTITQ